MKDNHISRRTRFQVDKLKCKKVVIKMIIEGFPYEKIAKTVKELGESCSKSGIGNYINNKLIEAKVNPDGTIEVIEKEGLLARVTKYPAGEDCYEFVESRLYADKVLYKTIEKSL